MLTSTCMHVCRRRKQTNKCSNLPPSARPCLGLGPINQYQPMLSARRGHLTFSSCSSIHCRRSAARRLPAPCPLCARRGIARRRRQRAYKRFQAPGLCLYACEAHGAFEKSFPSLVSRWSPVPCESARATSHFALLCCSLRRPSQQQRQPTSITTILPRR